MLQKQRSQWVGITFFFKTLLFGKNSCNFQRICILGKPIKNFVEVGEIAAEVPEDESIVFDMIQWATKSSKSILQIYKKVRLYKPASTEVLLPGLKSVEKFLPVKEDRVGLLVAFDDQMKM